MIEKEIVTADRIKKAIAAVKAERPAYEGLLEFYEKLFLAQEDIKGRIDIEPIQVPKEILSVKLKERLPLINKADFAVDVEASEALLRNDPSFAAFAATSGRLQEYTVHSATIWIKRDCIISLAKRKRTTGWMCVRSATGISRPWTPGKWTVLWILLWSRSRPCTSICWPKNKALKVVFPYGSKRRSL